MAAQVDAPGGVGFDIEHFAWSEGRLELRGHWSGVRGRRFVRPTLTARSPERLRLLADLEHKPWPPEAEHWIATFDCETRPAPDTAFELAIGDSLSIALPPLDGATGATTRFARTPDPPPRAAALPAEGRAAEPERAGAGPTGTPRAEPEPAAAPPTELRLAEQERDALRRELHDVRAGAERHARERDEAVAARLEAERALVSAEAAREVAGRSAGSAREERDNASARLDLLRAERDRALARLDALREERQEAQFAHDAAREDARRLEGEGDETLRQRKDTEHERERVLHDRDAAERKLARVETERDGLRTELAALGGAGEASATAPDPPPPIVAPHPYPTPVARRPARRHAAWPLRLLALAALLVVVILLAMTVT
jgi:hypothetical protein